MQFLKRSGEDDIARVAPQVLSILRQILIQKISLNKLITQIESIELSISKQVSNAEVSWLASIIDILLENLRLSRLIICIDRDWVNSIAFLQNKRFMFCFICQKISNLLWKKKKIRFLFSNFQNLLSSELSDIDIKFASFTLKFLFKKVLFLLIFPLVLLLTKKSTSVKK